MMVRICEKWAMVSSYSSTQSGIDRKSLKKPDHFMVSITRFFTQISKHTVLFFGGIAGLFLLGVGGAFYAQHREARNEAARNALYLAEKSLEKDAKATAGPVETQYADSIQKLKGVESGFGSGRAVFEARLKLGDLYLNHGDPNQASTWYIKAVDVAPGRLEKGLALSALAYAQENLEKPNEALQSFQKALNLGEASLKGDLLLGIARCYSAMQDSAKARSTYDQILTDLPNTEYSRTAEILKNRL